MMSLLKISSFFVVAVLFYSYPIKQARAQSADEPTENSIDDGENKEIPDQEEDGPSEDRPRSEAGQYHGVKPGSGNNLPKVAELKNKKGTWVTWPGFTMTPSGGSQVFLQTTGRVEPTLKSHKNQLEISIKRAKVFLSNNQNPLITTHFNTPLKRAYIKKRGTGLELILELKEKATPKMRQEKDPDGYHYLFLDFPAGQYDTGNTEVERLRLNPTSSAESQ